MSSKSRMAVNRLNAVRSTGPRTINGTRSSSRNARRHGLTAALTAEEIEKAYLSVTGEHAPFNAAISDARFLRLVRAQAQLTKARSFEQKVVFAEDDTKLTEAEIRLMKEVLADDLQRGMAMLRWAAGALGMKMQPKAKGGQMTKQLDGRVRRLLRQAEREYDNAH